MEQMEQLLAKKDEEERNREKLIQEERIRTEEYKRLHREEQERWRVLEDEKERERESQRQAAEAKRQAELMKRIIQRMRMQGVLAAFETWSGNVEEVVYARRLLKRVAYRCILRGSFGSMPLLVSLVCLALPWVE